ncbi:hypothetical protein HYPSUDRAFT_87646 [Hypholoma sublateritium FD-334 SS-4]|uniref:DUF6533 domain-containing protein n=1 Tax=Hypholoma sublateritium (strain FD-334 SS-4) TaxID=945553 RepID=A0A0D2MEI8_HYPSF|nr:hypothetical protein HYPSUDRAFT_87646 [Hypholoma sublateritium FD-334 SS-4]
MGEALTSLQVLNYVSLSAITVLVYDTILLFGDEVTLIWSAAWSFPKVLYIILRYYPFLHLSALFHIRGLANDVPDVCSTYVWYHGFGGVICILPPVSALFTLRVCALYRDSRKVIALVWILWAVETIGELVTTVRVEIGQHGSERPVIHGPGCFTVPKKDMPLYRSELLAWIPALFASCVLFLLTLFKLLHLFRYLFTIDNKKPGYEFIRLELSMLRDGTLYFFLIFIATLLTMVSDLSSKLGYFNDLWHPWFLLLYSIAGSRLVLNIRRNAWVAEPAFDPTSSVDYWGDAQRDAVIEGTILCNDIEAGDGAVTSNIFNR